MDRLFVYMRFLQLCGLSEDDGDNYRFLCDDAVDLIISRVREESLSDSVCGSLCTAAAALAALNFKTLFPNEAVSSFKAGDLTLQFDNGSDIDRVRKYYEDCLENIKPYLKDGEFVFEAV